MKRIPSILTISCAVAVSGVSRPIDFERDVRPILREKCHVCHGPGMQNRGLRLDRKDSARRVLVPAAEGEAELLRRIRATNAHFRMPPAMAAPLSAAEVDTLVAWIEQGAPWPEERLAPPAVSELFHAIDQNQLATVRRLTQDRTLVNAHGADLTTPLMHAALHAGLGIFDLLLKRGADPNVTDEGGATALIWAIHDARKVQRLIAAGAKVDVTTKYGTTALIAGASFPDSQAIVKQLLATGAGVNAANADGATALAQASASGNLETMRLLLEKGADPHLVPSGLSPLSSAAFFGHQTALKLLLQRGVGVNERDGFGATALHAAALAGETGIAKLLLEHGAEPNLAADRPLPSGQQLGTPLVMSTYTQPDGVMAKLLIRHGADANSRTSDGETALDRAQTAGHSKLVQFLIEAGARTDRGRSTGATKAVNSPRSGVPDRQTAIERSLGLLERSSLDFAGKCGCLSCHNQHLPLVSLAMARQRGVWLQEKRMRQASEITRAALAAGRDRAVQMMFTGGPVALGYLFLELAATGEPASFQTAVYLRNLAAQQLPSGKWRPSGGRPPQESSDFTATALSVRALKVYGCGMAESPTDCRTRIRRAQSWLISAEPSSTEDAAFQLLGLSWAGADEKHVRSCVRRLLSQQRPDGGWAQLTTLPSDGYATGEVLYALREAGGLSESDPAYRSGVEFLLRTQQPDGSWLVRSRTLRFQPYFEGGFPHGPNQFISVAATSWAVMALMPAR